MKSRCGNPKHSGFHRYGGRGIKVCEKWQSFPGFLEDMGERPKGMVLDRIDNNGNYEPGNCRWISQMENSNNKRDNVFFEFNGKRQTLSQWSRELGLNRRLLGDRRRKGWSTERMLTEPVNPRAALAALDAFGEGE